MTEIRGGKVICRAAALVPNSGVAALVGDMPMALFYLPGEEPNVFALDNLDPFSDASVARKVIGDLASTRQQGAQR